MAACAWAACDGPPRAPEAQAPPGRESAEVSIRFDVGAGKPTTVQILAFRATTTVTPSAGTGGWLPDVLGIVDPLAAAAPEQGCVLRDIDLATTTLMARGGSIELQEMTGIGVGVGGDPAGGDTLLRPFPHLYPDVATVVGGVVAEVGPQPVAELPERVSLFSSETELPVAELLVPSAARIVALNGATIGAGGGGAGAGLTADGREGLTVTVAGGAGGRVELRPFGATVAAACAIPAAAGAETVVNIPRALVAQLVRSPSAPGGAVPVSLEVARRHHVRQSLGSTSARISVEVRSAMTLELRP